VRAIAKIENVPEDHIMTWPGSNEALARSVVAFCSPTKSLVQADPTYETSGRAAKFLNVPIKNVPLKADYSHDLRAMSTTDANAGVIYVCNPNNPTGTMTPNSEIEWLVDNKPQGSVVVIDEAYIHWTRDYPNNTLSHLAAAGKDVLVMRTFSKIFGMAGMRIGYTMGRPELLAKLKLHDGGALSNQLPIPSAACAVASLTDTASIASRRKTLMENRAMTVDFLTKRGLKLIGPSEANMLMIDWKTKTSKEMQEAFRNQGVLIARVFPTWPTVSRISIGSKADMEGFFAAFNKVVSA
jgi:histidinol-phosphate aminotransferase